MTRWRPSAAASQPYITAAGFRKLEGELESLWARRRDTVRHLAAAAAEGDRSENAEYIYRKKELREIDRRLGYLQRRLPRLTVVRTVPDTTTHVYFGARVELENASGVSHCYRIVGGDEAEAARGAISVDSPVARALMGRRQGDEVLLATLDRDAAFSIVRISYPDPDSD